MCFILFFYSLNGLQINAEYDTRIETTLVDFRKMTELIERLMSKVFHCLTTILSYIYLILQDNRPSMEEMKAKLEQINEENRKRSVRYYDLSNVYVIFHGFFL